MVQQRADEFICESTDSFRANFCLAHFVGRAGLAWVPPVFIAQVPCAACCAWWLGCAAWGALLR
eukprot:476948-Alexandrium_andersonii.AAC.1